METNENILNKEKYFSEEILIKYINKELSDKESETLKYFIENDPAIADLYEGLKLLNNTNEIILQKENLNKKIDTFSKNKLKEITRKYFIIRHIFLLAIVIVTIITIVILMKNLNDEKKQQEKIEYNKNNNLKPEKYDTILFLENSNGVVFQENNK